MARPKQKTPDSQLSDFLATVATSVLVQYGVGGRVKHVTQQPDPSLWSIEFLSPDGSVPDSIMLRCTAQTPPHMVRSAMLTQLEIA